MEETHKFLLRLFSSNEVEEAVPTAAIQITNKTSTLYTPLSLSLTHFFGACVISEVF